MTRASAARVSFALMLISLGVPATPSLWAQENQWDKLMKAGGKAARDGMKEKYFHAWGDARPYPHFVKAEEEFLAALAQTQTFPAGDLRTAETLGALATVYSEEGKFAEAENRGNQAIAIMDASAKPDDPRLGYALSHLALIYDLDSKTGQAAPIWSRSLAILKNSRGVDPEELSNLEFQADNLRQHGPAGAAQIYQYILDLRESTGVSDKDLRIALGNLARVQRGSDAEQDYTRILEIDKGLYSPDSVETSNDLKSLAKLYADEGKYAAALPLLQRALEINQKAAQPSESKLGKVFDASDLIHLDRELAQAYAETGKDPEAEELYKQVISMDEKRASDQVLRNMSLNEDLRGLSRVYRDEHRYDEAVDTIKRSETIDDEIANSKFEKLNAKLNSPSIWLWLSQNELAEIYREKGDTAAAEPLFQRSLEMAQTLDLAPGHPKLAQLLDNYATLLRDEGKYDEAESLYKRALDTWAKNQYPENRDAAETLRNYAALLRKLDRPAEAEPLEARASAIRAKVGASNSVK
jgi:tetratricopeptide (TPR) repeat protein